MTRTRRFSRLLLVVLAILAVTSLWPAATDAAPPSAEAVTVRIQPPLVYQGHTYIVEYQATGAYRPTTSHLFFSAETPDFFQSKGITGMTVLRDGQPVKDVDELRTVFILYNAAHMLYIYQQQYLGHVPDGFADDMKRITDNPWFIEQYIKGKFKNRTDEILEAMRDMCAPQSAQGEADRVAQAIRDAAGSDQSILAAVESGVDALRLSRSSGIRARRAALGQAFSGWEKVSEQGTIYVKLGGKSRVQLADALDLLDLGTKLIWTADLADERAQWLALYQRAFSSGDAALDAEQRAASQMVKAETEQFLVQRVDIFAGYVYNKAWDAMIRIGSQALAKGLVAFVRARAGSTAALNVTSGISCFTLGLTLGNLLYGLDDLTHKARIAERSEELRLHFDAGRLQLQQRAKAQGKDVYNGEMAEAYRAAYMLEALASAQAQRSYADAIDAAVGKPVIDWFNPVNWFKGIQWKLAVGGIRQMADEDERTADQYIGHPSFIDAAVELVLGGTPSQPGATPVPDAGPVEAVQRLFAAIQRYDAAGAAATLNPVLGWLAQPVLDLGFTSLKDSGVRIEFRGLQFDFVEESQDRGQVWVSGEIVVTSEQDGTSESDDLDVQIPTMRLLGKWYVDVDLSSLGALFPSES